MGKCDAAVECLVAEKKEYNNERLRMEEEHQKIGRTNDFGCRFLSQNLEAGCWRGGLQVLEDLEEDAERMRRCEEKRKERARHWQCDSDVQSAEERPWRNEELTNLEEGVPQLKEESLQRAARSF